MRRFFRRFGRDLSSIEAPRLVEARAGSPSVVLGQTVIVCWQAERARIIEVSATSGKVRVNGRPGHGSVPVLLDESGFIEVRAVNDAGIDHRSLGPIAVVRPPAEHALPMAMPLLEWPNFAASPQVELPLLPAVELPVVPFLPADSAGEAETGSATQWPALPSARCPIGVLSLITLDSRLDLGIEPDGEGT